MGESEKVQNIEGAISGNKPTYTSTKPNDISGLEGSKLNVKEVPNVVDAQMKESGESGKTEYVISPFSKEIKIMKDFLSEEAPGISNRLGEHSQYLIGGMIAVPTYSIYNLLRNKGLVHFIHKTSTRSKIGALMTLTAGLAGYQLTKPQSANKFLKDFKDA